MDQINNDPRINLASDDLLNKMKNKNFPLLYLGGVLLCGISIAGAEKEEEARPEFVIVRVKKTYKYHLMEPKNPIDGIKSIAAKRNFNWDNVIFTSAGDGIKDFYFIIKSENKKQTEDVKIEFSRLILEYQSNYSVVIEDIQPLLLGAHGK